MSGATVTVRGTAIVPGKADQIELWLEVTALEQSPAAALDAVVRRSASIDELLTELGVAPERRLTTGVSVNEEREYDHDRAVHRGYRANNQTKVRFESDETVGTLMR